MNRKKISITIVILFSLLIMSFSTTAAKAPRTYFTATAEMIEMLDPGTTEVKDNNVHVRDMKQVYRTCWTFKERHETICYREVVVVNVDLSLDDMTGTMRGTFEFLNDNDEVVWEGVFYGSRKIVDGTMVSTVNDIGRGLGIYEGLFFQYTLQAFNIWDPSQPAVFEGTGFIQDTGVYTP